MVNSLRGAVLRAERSVHKEYVQNGGLLTLRAREAREEREEKLGVRC